MRAYPRARVAILYLYTYSVRVFATSVLENRNSLVHGVDRDRKERKERTKARCR